MSGSPVYSQTRAAQPVPLILVLIGLIIRQADRGPDPASPKLRIFMGRELGTPPKDHKEQKMLNSVEQSENHQNSE